MAVVVTFDLDGALVPSLVTVAVGGASDTAGRFAIAPLVERGDAAIGSVRTGMEPTRSCCAACDAVAASAKRAGIACDRFVGDRADSC